MKLSTVSFVLALTVGCGGGGGTSGVFRPLAGAPFGPALWTMDFDTHSQPLVGGKSGMSRYTDADGWLGVGTITSGNVVGLFPAGDGGTYASATDALYELPLDGAQWSTIHTWTGSVIPNATYVGPDGAMYATGGNTMTGDVWPPGGSDWQTGNTPTIVDRDLNGYYFIPGQNVTRIDAATQMTRTVIDCHTKDLQQCSQALTPLRFDDHGSLYFVMGMPIRVFRVDAMGGTPELVAALGGSGDVIDDYVYYKSTWITDDAHIFVTAARSTDAYSYGSTFRYEPGDSTGTMILASPTDFDASSDVSTAPDADVAVAPNGTIYSYLPTQGGVSIFVTD